MKPPAMEDRALLGSNPSAWQVDDGGAELDALPVPSAPLDSPMRKTQNNTP